MIPIEFIPDDGTDPFSANWPQVPTVGERMTHGDDEFVVTDVTWGFHVVGEDLNKVLYDKPCVVVVLTRVAHAEGVG